ncbi:MAG: hypothetical protein J6M57_00790, partial [Acidaminococcaceae bacterium]|nr:hypothetical protein [Acidaminococcaceae bacterium]
MKDKIICIIKVKKELSSFIYTSENQCAGIKFPAGRKPEWVSWEHIYRIRSRRPGIHSGTR